MIRTPEQPPAWDPEAMAAADTVLKECSEFTPLRNVGVVRMRRDGDIVFFDDQGFEAAVFPCVSPLDMKGEAGIRITAFVRVASPTGQCFIGAIRQSNGMYVTGKEWVDGFVPSPAAELQLFRETGRMALGYPLAALANFPEFRRATTVDLMLEVVFTVWLNGDRTSLET